MLTMMLTLMLTLIAYTRNFGLFLLEYTVKVLSHTLTGMIETVIRILVVQKWCKYELCRSQHKHEFLKEKCMYGQGIYVNVHMTFGLRYGGLRAEKKSWSIVRVIDGYYGKAEVPDLWCNKFLNLLNTCDDLRGESLLQNLSHEISYHIGSFWYFLISSATIISSVKRLKRASLTVVYGYLIMLLKLNPAFMLY